MKSLIFLLLLFPTLLYISCKKDPPTLNDKIEGNWRVTYYGFYFGGSPDDIENALSLKSEGANTGTIWWAEHRAFEGTKDTVRGTYTLEERANTLHIKWGNSHLYGITKAKNVGIDLSQDDLTLTYPDTFGGGTILIDTVRAVRN